MSSRAFARHAKGYALSFGRWSLASRHTLLRLQVKERLKSSKQEKAALRSADAKRGGGKAAKSVPGARAPGAKSGTRR